MKSELTAYRSIYLHELRQLCLDHFKIDIIEKHDWPHNGCVRVHNIRDGWMKEEIEERTANKSCVHFDELMNYLCSMGYLETGNYLIVC